MMLAEFLWDNGGLNIAVMLAGLVIAMLFSITISEGTPNSQGKRAHWTSIDSDWWMITHDSDTSTALDWCKDHCKGYYSANIMHKICAFADKQDAAWFCLEFGGSTHQLERGETPRRYNHRYQTRQWANRVFNLCMFLSGFLMFIAIFGATALHYG